MEILTGRWPPNISLIDDKFHVKDQRNVLYAYGNFIYNPSGFTVPDHLIVHEEVHRVRQTLDDMTVDKWWDKYITNSKFRLNEEVYAHRAEWGQFVQSNRDRNVQSRQLHFMAMRLSGKLYDHMIDFKEAKRRIIS